MGVSVEHGCQVCGHKFMDEITAWGSPPCPNCGSDWTGQVVYLKIDKHRGKFRIGRLEITWRVWEKEQSK